MKIFKIVLLWLVFTEFSYAQDHSDTLTFSSFYIHQKLGVGFGRHINTTDESFWDENLGTWAGTDERLNYFAPIIDVTLQSAQPHGFYFTYTNLWTSDFLQFIYLVGIEGAHDRDVDGIYNLAFTSGLTGEINAGKNILSRPKWMMAAGINLSSYRLTARSHNYRGSYYGPGVFTDVDFLTTEKLLLRGNIHFWKSLTGPQRFSYIFKYDLAGNSLRAETLNERTPVVYKFSFEAVTHKGFVAGVGYRRMDFVKTYVQRAVFRAGYRFWFDDLLCNGQP